MLVTWGGGPSAKAGRRARGKAELRHQERKHRMVRKAALDVETLKALGADRLARLVLEEAERDASFRKIVKAALAATKGPEAVAKLIDRRLAALEKARSVIDWQKERSFRDDLAATLATITGQLADASPAMGMERLLRFLGTHESVFERIDDSGGRLQDLYRSAAEATAALAPRLSPDEADLLPEAVMARLGETDCGYLVEVASGITPHLPAATLARWDAALATGIAEQANKASKPSRGFDLWSRRQWVEVRQMIAEARGDLDGVISLEGTKHPQLQDTVEMAERLLGAGRALDWVRRGPAETVPVMRFEDMADETAPYDPMSKQTVMLEARILEALGDKEQAQALRWATFEETLDADMLRAYVSALPDFEEFDILDRAFAHALASPSLYRALMFLLEWPSLDQAAGLVTERADAWDGRHYALLAPAADLLEEAHPLASTILLRALTDAILDRAYSKAYPHAARYLRRLDALAARIEPIPGAARIEAPDVWRAGIDRKHARKSGLWASLAQIA